MGWIELAGGNSKRWDGERVRYGEEYYGMS